MVVARGLDEGARPFDTLGVRVGPKEQIIRNVDTPKLRRAVC